MGDSLFAVARAAGGRPVRGCFAKARREQLGEERVRGRLAANRGRLTSPLVDERVCDRPSTNVALSDAMQRRDQPAEADEILNDISAARSRSPPQSGSWWMCQTSSTATAANRWSQ
jgi:hypothetical protein